MTHGAAIVRPRRVIGEIGGRMTRLENCPYVTEGTMDVYVCQTPFIFGDTDIQHIVRILT
jgi:hypothetical protein